MSTVEIEVINWEKYNPRTDRKKSSWFRLENSIAAEPKFFGLTAAQKFIAICLFAEASKKCGASASINVPWLADQLKIKESEIHKTIEHLVAAGVVKVSSGVAVVSSGCPTNVRTYERNERTNDTISTVVQSTPLPTEIVSDEDLRRLVGEGNLTTWSRLYDDPQFINRELIKIVAYYRNNSKKIPKSKRGWVSATASWLERGWGWRAKTIRGEAVVGDADLSDINWSDSEGA